MSGKVVTFGEIMLRLTEASRGRLMQSRRFEATFGGAEANVAVALAQWGVPVSYVTILPEDNPIADACIAELKSFGVDTDDIVRARGRLGVYFLEQGSGYRPSRVIYDRSETAIARAAADKIAWDDVLRGSNRLHVTGITPALSESAAAMTRASITAARRLGVSVSLDLNIRETLWQWGKAAGQVLPELIEASDLLIANDGHLRRMLPIEAVPADEEPEALFAAAFDSFPSLTMIALTQRDDEVYRAHLCDGSTVMASNPYRIESVVDQVGAGDAFAAGLIYGLDQFSETSRALEFGAAAACVKHSVPGDYCRASVSEIEAVIEHGTVKGVMR